MKPLEQIAVVKAYKSVLLRRIKDTDTKAKYYIVTFIDSLDHRQTKQFSTLTEANEYYKAKEKALHTA